MRHRLAVALAMQVIVMGAALAEPPREVLVPAGVLRPFYAPSEKEREVRIEAFWLDRRPVTNQDFAAFVKAHPRWRRDRVSRLFAEAEYLVHWRSADEPGDPALANRPVVRVSWFAAKAYCEARGARLPTENEWEYAAAAGNHGRDGKKEPELQQAILGWYARPANQLVGEVGKSRPNFYGIEDLHALVWEWVLDFNSTLVSEDSRSSREADKLRFCGSGALGSNDKNDYASFMRIAYRSSLMPNYTTASLGFRCARPVEALGGQR